MNVICLQMWYKRGFIKKTGKYEIQNIHEIRVHIYTTQERDRSTGDDPFQNEKFTKLIF